MSTDYNHLIAYGVAGSLLAYIYTKYRFARATPQGLRWPPGPTSYPLIGGVAGFPPERWYENFSAWQQKYGDIVYVDLMGTHLLVLNSLEDAEELANKRPNIYSGRPYHVIVTLMMEFGWSLLMRQPDKDFNEQRKLFRKAVGPQSVAQYDSLIEAEVERLIPNLSNFSGNPLSKLEGVVSAVILKIGYGEKIHKTHGKELAELNAANMSHTGPIFTTFYAVTVFPWMRHIPAWFPGTGFHEVARKGKELTEKIRDWAWGILQEDISNGTADLSLVSEYYNSPEFSKNNLKEAVSVMYGAGVDTTATACFCFLYYMVAHPDVQRKVRQELDEHIGRGRAPTPADCQKLEYLQAAWRESMRLSPPAPLGLPHVTSQADSWKGYYIPKETIVNCNIGYMLRDTRLWGPDANVFRPERLMGEEAKNLPDSASIPFGFGKRVCPGRFLANQVGMTVVANILSNYEVGTIPGEQLPNPMPFADGAIR